MSVENKQYHCLVTYKKQQSVKWVQIYNRCLKLVSHYKLSTVCLKQELDSSALEILKKHFRKLGFTHDRAVFNCVESNLTIALVLHCYAL